jgi:acetyl-CoA acyltransferase
VKCRTFRRALTLAPGPPRSLAFKNEIIPTGGHDADGVLKQFSYDEVIRPETTVEALSTLRPAFDPVTGTVTAGTSSPFRWCSRDAGDERKPRPRVRPDATRPYSFDGGGRLRSVDYGLWPGSGVETGAEKAGLTASDIDLFEMNEAFAAQILPCIKDLGLMDQIDEKINLNGGAIALGHPLGCSGAYQHHPD